MENEFSIRPATSNDMDMLAQVYKDAFNQSGFKEKWTDETAKKFMEFLYRIQPDLFFVAEKNGELVGGITSIVKPFWNGPYISDLEIFISPKSQSKGMGKSLLRRHLDKAIKKYGVITVDTTTTVKTKFPLSWYKKIGFEDASLLYISGDAKEILKNLN